MQVAQEGPPVLGLRSTPLFLATTSNAAPDDTKNEIQMWSSDASSKATSGMKLPDTKQHATLEKSPMRLLGKCSRSKFAVDSTYSNQTRTLSWTDARQMQEQRFCHRTKQHRGAASMLVGGARLWLWPSVQHKSTKCSALSSRQADCKLSRITKNIATPCIGGGASKKHTRHQRGHHGEEDERTSQMVAEAEGFDIGVHALTQSILASSASPSHVYQETRTP